MELRARSGMMYRRNIMIGRARVWMKGGKEEGREEDEAEEERW